LPCPNEATLPCDSSSDPALRSSTASMGDDAPGTPKPGVAPPAGVANGAGTEAATGSVVESVVAPKSGTFACTAPLSPAGSTSSAAAFGASAASTAVAVAPGGGLADLC